MLTATALFGSKSNVLLGQATLHGLLPHMSAPIVFTFHPFFSAFSFILPRCPEVHQPGIVTKTCRRWMPVRTKVVRRWGSLRNHQTPVVRDHVRGRRSLSLSAFFFLSHSHSSLSLPSVGPRPEGLQPGTVTRMKTYQRFSQPAIRIRRTLRTLNTNHAGERRSFSRSVPLSSFFVSFSFLSLSLSLYLSQRLTITHLQRAKQKLLPQVHSGSPSDTDDSRRLKCNDASATAAALEQFRKGRVQLVPHDASGNCGPAVVIIAANKWHDRVRTERGWPTDPIELNEEQGATMRIRRVVKLEMQASPIMQALQEPGDTNRLRDMDAWTPGASATGRASVTVHWGMEEIVIASTHSRLCPVFLFGPSPDDILHVHQGPVASDADGPFETIYIFAKARTTLTGEADLASVTHWNLATIHDADDSNPHSDVDSDLAELSPGKRQRSNSWPQDDVKSNGHSGFVTDKHGRAHVHTSSFGPIRLSLRSVSLSPTTITTHKDELLRILKD